MKKINWPRLLLLEAPFVALLAATSLFWWVLAAAVFFALSLVLWKLAAVLLAGVALVGAVWFAWRMWRALVFRVLDAIFGAIENLLVDLGGRS